MHYYANPQKSNLPCLSVTNTRVLLISVWTSAQRWLIFAISSAFFPWSFWRKRCQRRRVFSDYRQWIQIVKLCCSIDCFRFKFKWYLDGCWLWKWLCDWCQRRCWFHNVIEIFWFRCWGLRYRWGDRSRKRRAALMLIKSVWSRIAYSSCIQNFCVLERSKRHAKNTTVGYHRVLIYDVFWDVIIDGTVSLPGSFSCSVQ